MRRVTKTDYVYVRVEPELKELVREAAIASDRTFSAWIVRAIKEKLARDAEKGEGINIP